MSRPARINPGDAPIPRMGSGMRLGGFEAGGATSFRAAQADDTALQNQARYRVNLPTARWRTGASGGPLSGTLRFGQAATDDGAPSVTVVQGSSRDLRLDLLRAAPGSRRLSDTASGSRHSDLGDTVADASQRAQTRSVPLHPRPTDRNMPGVSEARVGRVPASDLAGEVTPTPFPPPNYLRHSIFWDRFYTFAPSSYQAGSASTAFDRSLSRKILPPSDAKRGPPSDDGPSVLPLSAAGEFDDQGGPIGLPTHWDKDDRWRLLEVDSTGKRLRFLGTGLNGDRDAAACRANRAMPPQAGIYYFEVEIVSKGLSGFIGIGFCTLEVKLSRLPGWEEHSWGYHGDDGHTFCSTGTGRRYGPQFTTGDVIGVGVDWSLQKAFFVKNGVMLGHVFSGIEGKLYPCCGLRTPGEEVLANFGDKPFRFSIDNFVQARQQTLRREISSRKLFEKLSSGESGEVSHSRAPPPPIDHGEGAPLTVIQLVATYLVHHGFTDTARAFKAQLNAAYASGSRREASTLSEVAFADEDRQIAARRRIQLALLTGDVDAALQDLQAHFPSVLSTDRRLIRFRLHLQRFIELIVAASSSDDAPNPLSPSKRGRSSTSAGTGMPEAALECGQSLFEDYLHDQRPGVQRRLRLAASLLAYGDPTAACGQAGKLASRQARSRLADEVNSVIWSSQGRPARPALESVLRHAQVVTSHLAVAGAAALTPATIV